MTTATPLSHVYDIDSAEALRRITAVLLNKAQRARGSISEFVSFVMREEHTQAHVRVLPHQLMMMEFALAHEQCVIMLPVGHSKTYSMAALALYLLGQDVTARGAVVSATQIQAAKPLSMVSDYIEHSVELQLVYPHLRPSTRRGDSWTSTAITVDRPPGIRDATVVAVGIEGALPGARLKWAVVDDILNHENTATKEGRDKTYDWFDTSVVSRLDPMGSRIQVTNTAWHPDDLLHRLRDAGWPTLRMAIDGDIELVNTDWDHPGLRPKHPHSVECRLTAHDPDPENAVPLWPEKYNSEVVAKLRRTHIPVRFNQLYLNICRDDASAKCKREWIELCKYNAMKQGIHSLVSGYSGGNLTFTGVDLAVSPGEESDDTSFFTFEALPSGHKRILDIEVGKYDGPTILNKLFEKTKAYKSVLRVENNAAQDYILQFARERQADLPIKPHTTGRTKAHPEHGVEGLFVELFNGAWLIPTDTHGQCHPHVQRWIDACLYYSPAKHTDDTLMSCYFAREQAKEWGVLSGGDTGMLAEGGGVGMSIMSR